MGDLLIQTPGSVVLSFFLRKPWSTSDNESKEDSIRGGVGRKLGLMVQLSLGHMLKENEIVINDLKDRYSRTEKDSQKKKKKKRDATHDTMYLVLL